jgi:alkylation response protein AidB-like acyl-CoA dehydrogenase
MDPYHWWNGKHKKIAKEAKKFADQNLPRGEEVMWTKEFPSDLLEAVGERGWFGAAIPEEYGGLGMGITGCCIVAEELSRVCSALTCSYSVTMFGGVEQLLKFGTEKQKKRWLPKIAKGKTIGAICITEPYAGSDAAGIETTARREGDHYMLNGKKRFTTNAGIADIYCLYAKTSDKPEDKAKYKHLSAFIVEKGTPGLSVERINELGGWIGLPNGYLDFDEATVPEENRLGKEGDGWKILVDGLNFERNLFTAGMLGPMREAIRYAVNHAERRIQFGQRTVDYQITQFKIADMIAKLHTARLLTYHSAYLMDMKLNPVLEATIAKLFASEAYRELMPEAIQVMGGDGWTRFYPVEGFARDAKGNEIGAGTSEVMRMVLFRWGRRAMAEDLKMPPRRVHEKIGVPISTTKPSIITQINEESVLELLARNYKVNPGLYMTRDDVKEWMSIEDEELDKLLGSLESKGLAKLYRDRPGRIALARATYNGLKKAKPLEYYQWFPDWINKEQRF